jgi:hypothetical protein
MLYGIVVALVVTSKEIGLDVNVEKANYTARSWDQQAVQSHNIKLGNESFDLAEQLK